jgi:antitoxin component HigA of HigAB toxin-antitoxin module
MAFTTGKRLSLSQLLEGSESVKDLNVRAIYSFAGDFVGFENVWLDSGADQNPDFFPRPLRRPENEDDYDALVQAVDEILEITGDDGSHPLASLLDIISDWIEEWDRTHHPVPKPPGHEVLGYLMREHGLTQSDLPGVGTQSVVSEILSGKRQLNLRQVRWLAEFFKLPVDVFV